MYTVRILYALQGMKGGLDSEVQLAELTVYLLQLFVSMRVRSAVTMRNVFAKLSTVASLL